MQGCPLPCRESIFIDVDENGLIEILTLNEPLDYSFHTIQKSLPTSEDDVVLFNQRHSSRYLVEFERGRGEALSVFDTADSYTGS